MKIIPQQNYLLVRLYDEPSDSSVVLPEGLAREPYGKIVLAGPDCKFCKEGDNILFMRSALLTGFDQGHDERFIISEGSVYAKCDPEATQDGHTELKILKNPAEENACRLCGRSPHPDSVGHSYLPPKEA